MAEPFSWTCPHCGRPTTVTDEDRWSLREDIHLATSDGTYRVLLGQAIVCPNPDCKQFTLSVELLRAETTPRGSLKPVGNGKSWRLVPPSDAKVFPDYIPQQIREDYEEACLVRDLSPKSSATLARRCLQGMIRDFWEVKKNRLIDEIEAIKDKVHPLTWKAIDGVRTIGNIGAHMEKDVNVIIDVEPEEAGQLIWLIEILVRDWYIDRHEREERLRAIDALAADKEKAKAPAVRPDSGTESLLA